MRFSDQDVARFLGSTTQPLPGETASVGDAEARFAFSILLCRKRIGPTGEFLNPGGLPGWAIQRNHCVSPGTVRFFAGKRSVNLNRDFPYRKSSLLKLNAASSIMDLIERSHPILWCGNSGQMDGRRL
jgi:hypothetical protein